MRENKLELLLTYIVSSLVLYALFALISLELNISNWDSYTKSLFVLGLLVLQIGLYFDYKSINTKKKRIKL